MISSRLLISRGLLGLVASAILFTIAAPGCNSTQGVGDPCRPEREYDATFNGFDVDEVNVESKSYQCQTRLCLVNHFQGRVTCPFGQKIDGTPREDGLPNCILPGTVDSKVTGSPDPKIGAEVKPNLVDRLPEKAVYCSCRCANADGSTDDGANYCECPDGFTCEQLVASIGKEFSQELSGGYCIKSGTKYNSASPTSTVPCSATNKKDCGG
ncbi:hypothetical protein LVJ94_35640 [Pendulispora rubella]|uniref:Uncharacterized protein n=1 Tax=Pendulispora rubella TaxID=2741070 RepID=A0ABZ2KUS2_9BACT